MLALRRDRCDHTKVQSILGCRTLDQCTYLGQELSIAFLPFAGLFFQACQLYFRDLQFCLRNPSLFLSRFQFCSNLPKLSLELTGLFGMILAVSAECRIALSENVELCNPLNEFSMLGRRSSIFNSFLPFLFTFSDKKLWCSYSRSLPQTT